MPLPRLPSLLTAGLVALALCSCEERPKEQVIETTPGPSEQESEQQAIQRIFNDLAAGKDTQDAKAVKRYDDAKDALIRKGSGIESQVIDELRRSEDWGIRYGLVEVLQATGTRACVPHLIAVLDDSEPLVAYMANVTLVEMTKHQEIPSSGTPGENGLPPVPKRDPTDLALDAEQRQWAIWQRVYGTKLRSAWDRWWSASKDEIAIK